MTKTKTPVPQDLIEDALDEIGWGGDYDTLGDNSYSGRGMYGDTCASITFAGHRELGKFLFQLGWVAATNETDTEAREGGEAVQRMVEAMRTDSMGTDIVAYFPGFELEG